VIVSCSHSSSPLQLSRQNWSSSQSSHSRAQSTGGDGATPHSSTDPVDSLEDSPVVLEPDVIGPVVVESIPTVVPSSVPEVIGSGMVVDVVDVPIGPSPGVVSAALPPPDAFGAQPASIHTPIAKLRIRASYPQINAHATAPHQKPDSSSAFLSSNSSSVSSPDLRASLSCSSFSLRLRLRLCSLDFSSFLVL